MGDIEDWDRTLRVVSELCCAEVEEDLIGVVHDMKGTVACAGEGGSVAAVSRTGPTRRSDDCSCVALWRRGCFCSCFRNYRQGILVDFITSVFIGSHLN